MSNDISLVILAGGNSCRMGEDKGLKPFLGRPLVQRMVDRLKPISTELLVTTNHPYHYAFLGRCLIPDLFPNHGALGGLYTAIASALFPIVAVVACDMPFANAALIEKSAGLLVEENVDAVVPVYNKHFEPLHAVYRRSSCLPVVRAAIHAGHSELTEWFSSIRVRKLNQHEVTLFDPEGLVFLDVNTPEEFNAAEKLAQEI